MSQPPATPPAPELGETARRGTRAIFATRILYLAVTAASITVLPRLIDPADFGIWAIASIALGLMTVVRELGMASAIVQASELTPEQQDAYFWTSVAVSVAAAALLALFAPLLAALYGEALVKHVVWVGCLSLAVAGLGLVHASLLRRRLEYGKVALIEGGGYLCALVASIAVALLWRNVWALVAGHVASAVWMCVASWIVGRWVPGAPKLRRIDLSFSLQVTAYNVLAHLGGSIGVVVGYRFSAADLGFFNRAQQLCFMAGFAFVAPITEVAFALWCRLKSEVAYRATYVAVARRVWVIFIPYAAVLPIVAPDLLVALLGAKWAPAAPILAWFAPAVFGHAFGLLFAQLMLSQGRGRELRLCALADLVFRGAGALAGSTFGIVGLAAGFALGSFLLSVPLFAWVAARKGPVDVRHQFAGLWPGLPLAATASVAAFMAIPVADALGLATGWQRLLLVGGSAALTWFVLCLSLRGPRNALFGRDMAAASAAA